MLHRKGIGILQFACLQCLFYIVLCFKKPKTFKGKKKTRLTSHETYCLLPNTLFLRGKRDLFAFTSIY